MGIARLGHNVKQSRPKWYGHVKCRDKDYYGHQGAGDAAAKENKTGVTKADKFGCGEEGHA